LIDFKEESGKINIEFIGATLRDSLAKHYDVVDFATPIQTIAVSKMGSSVEMQIDATGDYDNIALQKQKKILLKN